MTYFYIGMYGEVYKGDRYETLNDARKVAIKRLEAMAIKNPKDARVHHGIEVYRGYTHVGTVMSMEFYEQRKMRKYYWQMENGWYRLNSDGEKVEMERNWHPFGL